MGAGVHSTGRLSIPDLRKRIAGLGEQPFRGQLSARLSAAAFKLTMDTFKTSTDPYGNRWAALVARKGQPLLDTGRMRGSIFFNPLADGFRVDFSVPYAAHHQYGTTKRAVRKARGQRVDKRGRFTRKKGTGSRFIRGGAGGLIPRRQMFPMAETGGLPPTWRDVFDKEADALVRRAVRA